MILKVSEKQYEWYKQAFLTQEKGGDIYSRMSFEFNITYHEAMWTSKKGLGALRIVSKEDFHIPSHDGDKRTHLVLSMSAFSKIETAILEAKKSFSELVDPTITSLVQPSKPYGWDVFGDSLYLNITMKELVESLFPQWKITYPLILSSTKIPQPLDNPYHFALEIDAFLSKHEDKIEGLIHLLKEMKTWDVSHHPVVFLAVANFLYTTLLDLK